MRLIEDGTYIVDVTGADLNQIKRVMLVMGNYCTMMYPDSLPSAEPEIIRCKDCENWDTTWQNDWAKNYHYCPLIDGTRNGDWYCADAERRTDE